MRVTIRFVTINLCYLLILCDHSNRLPSRLLIDKECGDSVQWSRYKSLWNDFDLMTWEKDNGHESSEKFLNVVPAGFLEINIKQVRSLSVIINMPW